MPEMPRPKTLFEVVKSIFSVILIFDLILMIKVYNFRGNKNKNEGVRQEL
jgi:hypothetical protein